jgi:hypothetical protein
MDWTRKRKILKIANLNVVEWIITKLKNKYSDKSSRILKI